MPADIKVCVATGTTSVIVMCTVTADDNSGVFTVTSTHNCGDSFDLGSTTVSYTVTDEGGLATTDSFIITVEEGKTIFKNENFLPSRRLVPTGFFFCPVSFFFKSFFLL